MSSESDRVHPPMGPPDCPWKSMSAGSPVPESAVYQNGKIDGERAYIGRVYDGKSLFVGTAFPQKNVCIYVNKDLQLKSSTSYDILTCDVGVPLYFNEPEDWDDSNIFPAGIDGEEILYIGRHIDEAADNTYYGWVQKSNTSMYVPRDSKLGPQKISENFDVMIHRFADRICICPPCPYPSDD